MIADGPDDVLVFDNVRPARLTLDEMLGGGIGVWLFDEVEEGAPNSLHTMLNLKELPESSLVL